MNTPEIPSNTTGTQCTCNRRKDIVTPAATEYPPVAETRLYTISTDSGCSGDHVHRITTAEECQAAVVALSIVTEASDVRVNPGNDAKLPGCVIRRNRGVNLEVMFNPLGDPEDRSLWRTNKISICSLSSPTPPSLLPPAADVLTVRGELKRWHRITVEVDNGPEARESAGTANPFLGYRYTATFTKRGGQITEVVVPGHFAVDGNAAETGATQGTVWRAYFCPPAEGVWDVSVGFVSGDDVAIHPDRAGTPVPGVDGATATFTVAPTDKSGRDYRGKGMLRYRGERYLRFDNGEYFVKAGADSPETLLGFHEFDATYSTRENRQLHEYTDHIRDWVVGDPTWGNGTKGKALIGALNYLAGQGMNAFSFLTFNVGGDGRDVWPFVSPDNYLTYDVSKLDQWEIIFEHADRMGLFLHFKTQETENDNGDNALDGGNVGRERKLYYRELVSRFGHHLALNWNLGEENSQTAAQRQAMAQEVSELDPYGHLVNIHTYPRQQQRIYEPLIGSAYLTGASIQAQWENVHRDVGRWVRASEASGRPWVVTNDEIGGPNSGVYPDDAWPSEILRANMVGQVIYGTLFGGGGGNEAYFGYSYHDNDLDCETWRSRQRWWELSRNALDLFDVLPIWRMHSEDELVRQGDFCFVEQGQLYLVYHTGEMEPGTSINLSHPGPDVSFHVQWYDALNTTSPWWEGEPRIIQSGQSTYGPAPSRGGQAWVAVISAGGPLEAPSTPACSFCRTTLPTPSPTRPSSTSPPLPTPTPETCICDDGDAVTPVSTTEMAVASTPV